MPFAGFKEKRIARPNAPAMLAGFKLAATGHTQGQAEFRQGTPLLPFEIEKRGVVLRIRLPRPHPFPANMGQVQGRMKQRFAHRQGMAERLG